MTFARRIRVQKCGRGILGLTTSSAREGIVAPSTIRFAASAGTLAASLLVLGPSPAQAVADKGGSGSHSSHNDSGSRSNGSGNDQKRDAADWGNDILDVIDDGDPKPANNGPNQAPGRSSLTDAGDIGDLPVVATFDSGAPDGPIALRSGQAAAPPESANAQGAVPRASSGSDHVRPPTLSVRSPRVVIGNGRSPGLQARGHAPGREAPVAEEAPPEPVAIEVNVPPPPLPPVERVAPRLPIVEEMARAEVDPGADPLFGLAGLVLIPLVGAALGYRQARAAQAVGGSAGS